MIVRTNKLKEGQTLEQKGDDFILTNTFDLEPYLKDAYEARKDQANGWSKDREWRSMGRVPIWAYTLAKKMHPEIIDKDPKIRDRKMIELFKGEWSMFRTVDKI